MIHVEGLSKRYGDRVLFEDVSWHVKKRDRIGLSGPNGSGKTTLLKLLAGQAEPDSGTIRMASDTTIGYLPQDGIVHHGRTLHEEVSLAFEELLRLKEEQHGIEDSLAGKRKSQVGFAVNNFCPDPGLVQWKLNFRKLSQCIHSRFNASRPKQGNGLLLPHF